MVFNSDVFLFVFLPVTFALFWAAPTKVQRYTLLTVSGYVFYGWWNWRFCFLLFFSSLISYVAALLITRSRTERRKRWWVLASITIDLSLLGFFKYYDFFASTANSVARTHLFPALDVVLPIGISFYTFHTISYVLDVFAGRIHATANVWKYLAYVSLFPQLVAGPIVRYRQIEDDLDRIDGPPRADWWVLGIGFFCVGLAKKVILADRLASWVDPLLIEPGALAAGGAWLAAFGYAFQVYFDFSGYSDMAVGLGYLFGLRIPINFDAPYRAVGVRDLWRRWHISLSSWLRDYVYLPLGGSRGSRARTSMNLFGTMVLAGLWHGAGWTFIVFGAYQGMLLILDREFEQRLKALPTVAYQTGTFLSFVIGLVVFRSESLGMAGEWLATMAGLGRGSRGAPVELLLWTGFGALVAFGAPETWRMRLGTSSRWAIGYAVGLFVVYLFMNGRPSVFLYYQF